MRGTIQRGLTAEFKQFLLDYVYKVGGVPWISEDPTNPGEIIGGTWEPIVDPETGGSVFLLSASEAHPAGETGGEAAHTLTTAELPLIEGLVRGTLSGSDTGVFQYASGVFSLADSSVAPVPTDKSTNARHQTIEMSFGGGQAHNNMPPYLVVYMWRRTA